MEGSPAGQVRWQILQRQVGSCCAKAGGTAASLPENRKAEQVSRIEQGDRIEGWGERRWRQRKGFSPVGTFWWHCAEQLQHSAYKAYQMSMSKGLFVNGVKSLDPLKMKNSFTEALYMLYLCLSFLRMRPPRKEVLQKTTSRKTTKRLVMRARRRSQNQRKT